MSSTAACPPDGSKTYKISYTEDLTDPHRGDFTSRFIDHGTSNGTAMAAIDWDAAVTALASGGLPCSGGERRALLLSASLADGIPVDLGDAVTGLDDDNLARLITAILHAAGKRPGTSGY